MRMYETQYIGQQKEPIGFFGNDFGGDILHPVLINYTIVGFMDEQLWLRSKTGDSSDVIAINFVVNKFTFNTLLDNQQATFYGQACYDHSVKAWYYTWTMHKAWK